MRENKPKLQEPPREPERGGSFYVDDGQQTSDFYSRFGLNVQRAREAANITQLELSKRALIDRSYLSEIETGKRRVSLFIAFKIASLLGINLDDLTK